MTNHKLKVHNITKSPIKTSFMDISSFSELDHTEEQEFKEAADELELIANMTSQIDFDD